MILELLHDLVCHVISEDHMIKRSRDFICRSPLRQVTTLQSLVVIAILIVELLWFYFVT